MYQHLPSGGFYGYSFTNLQVITCNLSLLDGERNDQVERSQSGYIQPVHAHCPVCGLREREPKQTNEVDTRLETASVSKN